MGAIDKRSDTRVQANAVATSIRAAEYVRMSTDQQKYSIQNQQLAIRAYAEKYGMTIVRTYADEGKSGLNFDSRDGLKRLILDVQSGATDFKTILVYDVSRWGRFQDIDESAHYEYLCRHAGITVNYCAELFANDGSPLSAIMKSIKRAMAGEYSRELSAKVFAGQRRLLELGFKPGGLPGFGLRRILIDQNGVFKCDLGPGEWKSIITDRVMLVPGPAKEVDIVRWIFTMFVQARKTEYEIAKMLNQRGIRNHVGNIWIPSTVRTLLKSEKYIGNYVWNRKSFKLRRKIIRNHTERWMRAEHAFEPIVNQSLFDAAQVIFRERPHRTFRGRPRGLSDQEMIERLAEVYRAHGRLSRRIIDQNRNLPSEWSYRVRFGSIERAYELVGFKKDASRYGILLKERKSEPHRWRGYRDDDMLEALKRLLQDNGYLSNRVIDGCEGMPSVKAYRRHFGSLRRVYELVGYERPFPSRPEYSDEALLNILRRVWSENGDLSRRILQKTPNTPSSDTYYYRFGGLSAAYRLIGFTRVGSKSYLAHRGITNEQMLEKLRRLLSEQKYLTSRLIDETEWMPSRTLYCNRFGSVRRAYKLIGYREEDHRIRKKRLKPSSACQSSAAN